MTSCRLSISGACVSMAAVHSKRAIGERLPLAPSTPRDARARTSDENVESLDVLRVVGGEEHLVQAGGRPGLEDRAGLVDLIRRAGSHETPGRAVSARRAITARDVQLAVGSLQAPLRHLDALVFVGWRRRAQRRLVVRRRLLAAPASEQLARELLCARARCGAGRDGPARRRGRRPALLPARAGATSASELLPIARARTPRAPRRRPAWRETVSPLLRTHYVSIPSHAGWIPASKTHRGPWQQPRRRAPSWALAFRPRPRHRRRRRPPRRPRQRPPAP
jgi:hypothetical protein